MQVSIVAERVDVVIGVDTHKQTHTAALVLVAAGTCTVRANQSGDGFWAAAPAVNRSFKVT